MKALAFIVIIALILTIAHDSIYRKYIKPYINRKKLDYILAHKDEIGEKADKMISDLMEKLGD